MSLVRYDYPYSDLTSSRLGTEFHVPRPYQEPIGTFCKLAVSANQPSSVAALKQSSNDFAESPTPSLTSKRLR